MIRRLECKDIPDEVFLAAVDSTEPMAGEWRSRWAVKGTLDRVIERDVPHKLVLAKAKKLIDRGLMHGCPCGCRGDFHRPTDRCC